MPFHKISNFKFQISNLGNGYTLIEFLVVLGLLVITIGSTLLFLTSILRGTNQTNVANEVKQNGQAVLDSLERQIRGARSAVDMASLPPGVSDGIVLTLADNSNLYIGCLNTTTAPLLNNAIGVKTGTPPSSANDYQTVTNRDPVSGINITGCSLSVPAPVSTLNADEVVISFTADRAIKAPTRADFNASARFQTTISLRKY